MVADSLAGMAFLKAKAALERKFGIDNEIIDAADLHALAPALSRDMLGAEYAPQEGKINPEGDLRRVESGSRLGR